MEMASYKQFLMEAFHSLYSGEVRWSVHKQYQLIWWEQSQKLFLSPTDATNQIWDWDSKCNKYTKFLSPKHVEIDIHFVRERVALGQFRVLHIPTQRQLADIMTKGLPAALFEEFKASLCIRPSKVKTEGYG